MSMDHEITPHKDYLLVRVTGDFSLTEANDTVVKVFEALIEHGVRKVLVDCRDLHGEPTTLERFVHATFAAHEMKQFSEAGLSRGTRFGYVGKEPLIDKSHFGETVAVNRGINVKISLDLNETLRWLEIDEANHEEGQ